MQAGRDSSSWRNVAEIGGGAFAHCESLTEVALPESITAIGESAFAYCISLTRMRIPAVKVWIGMDAFDGCGRLTLLLREDSTVRGYCREYGVRYTTE